MHNWQRFEFDVAAGGGSHVTRSGAGEFEKLDASFGDFLIDCKTDNKPETKRITLTLEQWTNAVEKAKWEGKLPAMAFQLYGHPVVQVALDDFKALNNELEDLREKMKTVTKAPKLTKNNKEIISYDDEDIPSVYFEPIREFWIQEQERSKQKHKWSGRISPSAKISPRMCIEKFFKKAPEFLEFGPKLLYKVRFGTLIHTGMFESVENIPQLLYPYPDFKDLSLRNWFNKIRPEVPVDCVATGIRGKIDQVVAKLRDGEEPLDIPLTLENVIGRYDPCIFDLKTTWMPKSAWNAFKKKGVPKSTHRGQILTYMNRLRAAGTYGDVEVNEGCVGYLNMAMPPFSPGSYVEMHFQYDPYSEIMDSLVESIGVGRRLYLSHKKVRCEHLWCPDHGEY